MALAQACSSLPLFLAVAKQNPSKKNLMESETVSPWSFHLGLSYTVQRTLGVCTEDYIHIPFIPSLSRCLLKESIESHVTLLA